MAPRTKGFQLKGMSELNQTIRNIAIGQVKTSKRILFMEAETIMRLSKRIVPVDTGALRSSGFVKLPTVSRGIVSVKLGYGGSSAPYAVFVHENTRARHRPPTRSKFLEIPLNARRRGMVGRYQVELMKTIREQAKRRKKVRG